MISHPLILAVLGCDLGAVLLLLGTAWVAARVVASWQPGAASRAQLRLERHLEVASLAGRFAVFLFVLGTLVLVVATAGALPALVPGAMCGTGVMQATDGLVERALALRLLALVLLGVWRLVARLDDAAPRSPLAQTVARLVLLATPVTVLAGIDTWQALLSLDVHTPVDCCAVVYDQVSTPGDAAQVERLPDGFWTGASFVCSGLVLLLAFASLRRPGGGRRLRTGLLAATAVAWAFLSTMALVRLWAAYHYGVLEHHCLWCLFLAEHDLVGSPLFFALWFVLFEGIAAAVAMRVAVARPELELVAARRARHAVRRVIAGLVLFGALTWGPALWWRVQHGVWLHG